MSGFVVVAKYVVIMISHKLSSNTLTYANDAMVKFNISNSIITMKQLVVAAP